MPAAAPAAQTFKQTFCALAIIARLLLAAGTLITVAPSLRDAVSSAPNRHFAASHGSCCPGRDASSRWQLASAQHRLIASSIGPARVSAPSQRRDDVSAALPGRASPVSRESSGSHSAKASDPHAKHDNHGSDVGSVPAAADHRKPSLDDIPRISARLSRVETIAKAHAA